MNTIFTHNGAFHADDVFACAALRLRNPDSKIVRTRDLPEKPSEGDIFVDVGGMFDPAKCMFDHHQKDHPTRWSTDIRQSGFGLIWEAYGFDVCSVVVPHNRQAHLDYVVDRVLETLVLGIDAADNGIEIMAPKEGAPEARVKSLSMVIAMLNAPRGSSEEEQMAAFEYAVELAKKLLISEITYAQDFVWGKEVVQLAAVEAEDQRILVLKDCVPWQEHTQELPEALYAVFQDPMDKGWRVQCVPGEEMFSKRKALPEQWAGLRNNDLAALTGVPDAVFCHPGRFIAGAGSKEGALQMAKIAIA